MREFEGGMDGQEGRAILGRGRGRGRGGRGKGVVMGVVFLFVCLFNYL